MSQPVVFVDVDDTLVRSVGAKRIPMPNVIARIRELHTQGVALYLWSSGGADYAREAAKDSTSNTASSPFCQSRMSISTISQSTSGVFARMCTPPMQLMPNQNIETDLYKQFVPSRSSPPLPSETA
jgi:hypothetical protein